MPSHPNRGREAPCAAPAEIAATRAALGLTMAEAASRALVSERAWIKWERGERPISAPAWALFRLRSRLVTLRELERESI